MTRDTRPTCSASSVTTPTHPGGKKIGLRPGTGDTEKRTNEIGTILPLLETLPDIEGRTITADALLTQRALATYLLDRGAHYLFTVKGNQPTLLHDIRLTLDECIARRAPDFAVETPKPEHGRCERRSIWASCELNDYVNFPGVAQVFAVRRDTVEVQSGKRRCETAYGLTSLTPQAASPQRLLTLNRGHWTIEATHHILDWSFDEDRSRIRTGHGPENMTRLRRSPPTLRTRGATGHAWISPSPAVTFEEIAIAAHHGHQSAGQGPKRRRQNPWLLLEQPQLATENQNEFAVPSPPPCIYTTPCLCYKASQCVRGRGRHEKTNADPLDMG